MVLTCLSDLASGISIEEIKAMKMRFLATAAVLALGVATAGGASAATVVYDLNHYAAGFTGSLGTVTVSDNVANQLLINVNLTDNTFFQVDGGQAARTLPCGSTLVRQMLL
jgi:hypothetical protein